MLARRRFTGSQLAVALAMAVTVLVTYVSPGAAQTTDPAAGAVRPQHVVLPDQAAPPATPGGPGLVDNPARGVVFADLDEGSADGPCAGLLKVRGRSGVCTHGPDPAPAGVDVRAPRSTAELAATTAGATAGVPCYGDGTSGKRVQAIYVRASDVPDRYSSVVGLMGQWAANTDRTFADSAAETGGTRHVRWVTDAGCNLVVERAQLSPTGDDSFSATSTELRALGFNRTDRKYLLWVDANVYCGIAGIWGDDRATADNANNGGPSYARVDSRCWGASNPVEAHELMHNLGGVQLSAPHTSGGYHCTDEYDLMCYVDASGVTMSYVCASTHDRLFDCNHEDYFHTAPPSGTYLATHWNAAASAYLETADPVVTTTTTTVPPPSTTTTTTTAPPPTTTTIPPTTTTTTTVPPPPPTTTTTTVPPPPPPTATATYSASLNKKNVSRTYAVVTGSGTLQASVRFSKASTLTVKILDSSGALLGQSTGISPVALSVPVPPGGYRVVVSGSTTASFTLTVTYPSP